MVSIAGNKDDLQSPELSSIQTISLLGQGTYGEVWKGINLLNNELLAIKKIKTDTNTQGIPSTTLREICLLRELSHPNIVEYNYR